MTTEQHQQEQQENTNQTVKVEQERKPKRRSFFKISKDQIVSTKESLLHKLKVNDNKNNDADQDHEQITGGSCCSPVELPQIEQLQPMETDISSELPSSALLPTEEQSNEASVEENEAKEEIIEQDNVVEAASEVAMSTGQVKESDKEPPIKSPLTKRSSILSKIFFSKKQSSNKTKSDSQADNNDAPVTGSMIDNNTTTNNGHHPTEEVEQQQEEVEGLSNATENHHPDEGNETSNHNHNQNDTRTKEEEGASEEKQKTTTISHGRPSSPIGRKFNEFLSRIPTLKDKRSSVSSLPANNNNSNNNILTCEDNAMPVDNVEKNENGPDENRKSASEPIHTTTAIVAA